MRRLPGCVLAAAMSLLAAEVLGEGVEASTEELEQQLADIELERMRNGTHGVDVRAMPSDYDRIEGGVCRDYSHARICWMGASPDVRPR